MKICTHSLLEEGEIGSPCPQINFTFNSSGRIECVHCGSARFSKGNLKEENIKTRQGEKKEEEERRREREYLTRILQGDENLDCEGCDNKWCVGELCIERRGQKSVACDS